MAIAALYPPITFSLPAPARVSFFPTLSPGNSITNVPSCLYRPAGYTPPPKSLLGRAHFVCYYAMYVCIYADVGR